MGEKDDVFKNCPSVVMGPSESCLGQAVSALYCARRFARTGHPHNAVGTRSKSQVLTCSSLSTHQVRPSSSGVTVE